MTDQNQVQPPRRSTSSWRRGKGRWLWPGIAAIAGASCHLGILAVTYREPLPASSNMDWRGLEHLVFSSAALFLSLLVGTIVAWRPTLREVGIGLIIGTSVGMVGAMLWALALTESPGATLSRDLSSRHMAGSLALLQRSLGTVQASRPVRIGYQWAPKRHTRPVLYLPNPHMAISVAAAEGVTI